MSSPARIRWCFFASLPLLAACASTTDPAPVGSAPGYEPCAPNALSGEFVLKLDDENKFTGIERGEVLDAPSAQLGHREVMSAGACRILQPAMAPASCASCDALTQECTATGCKMRPRPQDVGTVTMTGLKVPLTLTNLDNRYTNPPGVLPHPGFDEGADITLQASGGAQGYGPFTLRGWGVGSLQAPAQPIAVENGKAATITWTPGKNGPTQMLLTLGVNWHGDVDTWLECEAPDTGSFTIPASTMTALFSHGVSGFPRATLSRRAARSTTVKSGCAQLVITSEINRDVAVPGLVSCNEDDECPPGKKCGDDLSCK